MAFGRKARRIAELERQLEHAMNNLAVAYVPIAAPCMTQKVTVEKGKWYVVRYEFQHVGAPDLLLGEIFVGEIGASAYFDGVV